MIIKFAPATLALMALDTHTDYDTLDFMTVDGPFIIFDFGEGATTDSVAALVDAATSTVDDLVAETQLEGESGSLLVALRAARNTM